MPTFPEEVRNLREYIAALSISNDDKEAVLHQVDRLMESIDVVQQHGVRVAVTDNTDAEADAVLVLIDTDDLGERNMRIRINDALLYEGNPEAAGSEYVERNEYDGLYIRQH